MRDRGEKRIKMMMIIRGKTEKTSKSKSRFNAEELLDPQASLRVTPCPPAPNHTRGEVIRPPSQIKNNSYSVIRTRDLDDLTCTRCAPTITSRPSGICIIKEYKLSVWRVFKYRAGGGRVRKFVQMRLQSSVSGQE